MTKDINVNIAKLQKDIAQKLGLSTENVIFDFSSIDGVTKLDLITINPRHEQSFLYHTEKGIDKVETLEKMLKYVLINNKEKNHYTVQWTKNGESELHTSYFRAKNIYEALDKFYYNRELNTYVIFNITLNPVA